MYKEGQIIAVNSNIYEYVGIESAEWTKGITLHKVSEIDMDDEGHLTPTYDSWYFTNEELANSEVDFTQQQWRGIVDSLIRYNYDLDNEEIDDAVEDIVCRCFAYGIPKVHELESYIEEYMNR